MRRPLHEILDDAGVEARGVDSLAVDGVTCDSRRVAPGWLFIALPGAHQDGAAFVHDALRRGAVAVASETPLVAGIPHVPLSSPRRQAAAIVAAYHGHPARSLDIVGVTGTNGKTTVAWLVESILVAAGRRPGLLGTVITRTGGHDRASRLTTPAAEDLHSQLAEMRDAGLDSAAMELSSHALAQDRAWGVPLAAAVFTNFARDHLDYHVDREHYLAAKTRISELVRAGGALAANCDDAAHAAFVARLPAHARRIDFSVRGSSQADLTVDIESMDLTGSNLALRYGGRRVALFTRLFGAHNVENVLAAAGAGLALGLDLEDCARGIARFPGVPGRLEEVPVGSGLRVFVDYAHTPDALEKVLGSLRALAPRRIHLIFGCGGDRDRGKRAEMGRIAERLADRVTLTDDNPRTEEPARIIESIRSGMVRPDLAPWIPDRTEAIIATLGELRPQDTLVIAGKGHETEQVVGTQRHPHDDREIVRLWRRRRDEQIERAT